MKVRYKHTVYTPLQVNNINKINRMAKFTRIQVALRMNEVGMIPVYYNPDAEVCKAVVKACYDGGARVFEFTNRGDFAHEVFGEVRKFCLKELPEMMLGVGSVLDGGTTSLYIQLGADFIVSPILSEEMGRVCNRRKILWSPGCGSITEISRAEELGAEVVKIFPGSQVGGPKFVAAVRGPHALEQHNAHRRGNTRGEEPPRVVRCWGLVRGDGIAANPFGNGKIEGFCWH